MKRQPEQDLSNLEEEVKQDAPTSSNPKEAPASDKNKPVQEFKRLPPKLRIVMITGYNGSQFFGSQKNQNVRTVESELEEALYRTGVISDFNRGDLKKIAFNRATRTDKKVHALQNVFSCKVHLPKKFDPEEYREKLNQELPEDIRVFCVLEVSNSFNAKLKTSNREYSYYLPTFLLKDINELFLGTPGFKKDAKVLAHTKPNEAAEENQEGKNVQEEEKKEESKGGIKIFKREQKVVNDNDSEPDDQGDDQFQGQDRILSRNIDHVTDEMINQLYSYRISEEQLKKVQRLFGLFLGTKKYHNYTRDIKPTDNKSMRFMLELTCNDFMYVNRETFEVTDKNDPKALEFLHFFLKGQSFLYNQIRKMIGVIIQINRGRIDESFLDNTQRDNTVNVALAPGDGLLLEKVCYDKYNEVNSQKKNEIMLKFVKQSEEVQKFREDIVKYIVKSEAEQRAFIRWLTYFDDYCDEYYVSRNEESAK